MAPDYYTFTGRDGEVIPQHVTHVLVGRALKFVRARAFYEHPNIEELVCHDGVRKIEHLAFFLCPRLRRVVMTGVKEVEDHAFDHCKALTYIECDKLKRIGRCAFRKCESLSSVDLPSARIVKWYALGHCTNLKNVKLGKDLKSIEPGSFWDCTSLERIALPLKDGMIIDNNVFQGCAKLRSVDLIGGVHETIAALLMEEWKNDMNEEIEKISQILLRNTPAGNGNPDYALGGKTQAIRAWITTMLRKFNHYKAEHRRCVNMAAALEPALPNDIVLKNVFPFLAHTFEGEN